MGIGNRAIAVELAGAGAFFLVAAFLQTLGRQRGKKRRPRQEANLTNLEMTQNASFCLVSNGSTSEADNFLKQRRESQKEILKRFKIK